MTVTRPRPLSDAERRDWLRLARSQNVGPVTFAALIERFHSATAALEQLPRLARRGGATGELKIPGKVDAERELETTAKLGARVIASVEPDFPFGLAALDAPPPVIAVLGDGSILSREMVAIVGARNASALGRKFAAELASDLGSSGLVVVSGMARGIDTAAHDGALATGTVAVLAGGVDDIYPPENARLYERIRESGAIVSEMPVAHKPQAQHFPRRNRIISGLSRGVIVVEAAEGSGSLITARLALEQGREVFAVPGSPLDPRAKGTNRLLRDGAALVENAEDVLEVLRPLLSGSFREPSDKVSLWQESPSSDAAPAEQLRRIVTELLGASPVSVDEIIRQSGASAADVLCVVVELELAGRIQREAGGQISFT
ncbi:MAG TPA: DNA-processing protein DprA [Rhizomicrobium sp.]|nr:DNA-processing protein DprA [Rhizomicrobium sp.]